MGLDNVKLSPYLLKELYENSLIELSKAKTPALPKERGTEKSSIKHLGKNEKNILITVNEEGYAFLSDADLSFLISVLGACSLTIEDCAVVNCSGNSDAVYDKLLSQFNPGVILFLGTEPQQLGFPLQIPHYKVQEYNNQQYLCAPALQELSADKSAKKLFWEGLKKIFSER